MFSVPRRSWTLKFEAKIAGEHTRKKAQSWKKSARPSPCRCSRVRVRRVVVPKNIQPVRTKCSWTTTLTGKLSSFGLDPRRSSNFSFCFEHSDSVWLRVPRPWPGMPRSANLAGVTNCCWIHPTLYLKWRPRREWRDTNRSRMGVFDHRSLSKCLQTRLPFNLLKLPKMWRLLMRVEKRLMVLSLVPEPTWRNIQHLKDLSLSCLQSVFLRLSNGRCFMIHSIR